MKKAASIGLGYAVFGVAWILLSDTLLSALAADMAALSAIGLYKGLLFVLATSVLVYLLARRPASAAPNPSPSATAPRAQLGGWPWLLAGIAVAAMLMGVASVAGTARDSRAGAIATLRTVAELKAAMLQAPLAQAKSDAAALVKRPALLALPDTARGMHASLFRRVGQDIEFIERGEAGDAPIRRLALAHPSLAIARASRQLSLDQARGQAPQVVEGIEEANGEPVYAVAVAVPGSDWLLAIEQPKREIDARAWGDASWVALVAVLALVLAGTVAFLALQRRALQGERSRVAEQRERLRALQLIDAISRETTDLLFATDAQGRFLLVNEALCRFVGKPREALLGHGVASGFAPRLATRLRRAQGQVMSDGRIVRSETSLATPAGERHFLDTLGPLHDSAGQVIGMFGVSRDITERKREEDQRRQWAMAFENTRDGVMITDARARIVAVNRAFSDITGHAKDDVIGQTPGLLRSGRHGAAFYSRLWRVLRATGSWQGEIWNRRKSGEVYPEWLTISAVQDEQGRTTNYVGVFTDISRIKHSEAEIERLAQYDPLTSLPNRTLLHERLAGMIERGDSQGRRTAVLTIDLDGFKTVNDSLGHPAGDELLVRVAARLRARLCDADMLGRLGGDEFLVLVEGVDDLAQVSQLASRLLQTVAEPVRLAGGQEAYVTASIGISVHPDDRSTSAVEMLRDADAAMYRAKEEGRNRFRFYTGDLHAEAVNKLDMEAALSRALERGELRLHYQPKVDARSGALTGVEALLRWQRGGELVPPGRFMALAESSSLMLSIGAWVVDEACRQMRAWLDAGFCVPSVAVNLSARQFTAGDLDAVLDRALRRHRLPPQGLQLELTESMLVARPDEAEALLGRLKALGVSIALDDFGTGYCNLSYLQRFPIDVLKIDQTFVQRIGQPQDGAALVDAIIALARRLHLQVVAEGVEAAGQCVHLRAQGCDELQGYHFSRPLPAGELEQLLADPGWARPLLPPAGGSQRPRPSLVRV